MPKDRTRYRSSSRHRSSSYSSEESYDRGDKHKSRSKKRYRSKSRDSESSRRRRYSRSASRERYSKSKRRSSSKTRTKKYKRRSRSVDQSRSSSRDKHRSCKSKHKKSSRRKSRSPESRSSRSSSSSDCFASSTSKKTNGDADNKIEKAIKAAEAAGLTLSKLPSYELKQAIVKADMPTIQDRHLLEEINSESFVPKTFTSSRNKKSENIVIDLDNQTVTMPELEIKEEESIINFDELPTDEELKEMWIRKLYALRKKLLEV